MPVGGSFCGTLSVGAAGQTANAALTHPLRHEWGRLEGRDGICNPNVETNAGLLIVRGT